MSRGRRTRVLLLEDHVVLREGLRVLLERERDLEVVGEAGSLAGAIGLSVEPDVVIADLVVDDAQGTRVVSALRERFPDAAILILTMSDDTADVRAAFVAGARGYILKEAASVDVVEAVRQVARGEPYLQPALGAAMARVDRTSPARSARGEDLTDREQEVLQLIAAGHTNAEIAGLLYLSLRTIEGHRARIMQKLGLSTRSELVRYARDAGLTPSS